MPVSGNLMQIDEVQTSTERVIQLSSRQLPVSNNAGCTYIFDTNCQPIIANSFLVCQTPEAGYSFGDMVAAFGLGTRTKPTPNMYYSENGLHVRLPVGGENFWVSHKQTGVPTDITNANWKILFRVYCLEAGTNAAVEGVVHPVSISLAITSDWGSYPTVVSPSSVYVNGNQYSDTGGLIFYSDEICTQEVTEIVLDMAKEPCGGPYWFDFLGQHAFGPVNTYPHGPFPVTKGVVNSLSRNPTASDLTLSLVNLFSNQ